MTAIAICFGVVALVLAMCLRVFFKVLIPRWAAYDLAELNDIEPRRPGESFKEFKVRLIADVPVWAAMTDEGTFPGKVVEHHD